MYEVHAGIPIFIVHGGFITQTLRASADRIDAMSVIVDLGSTIANQKDRSLALHVQSDQEHIDETLTADSIVDNGVVRFNFPSLLQIKDRNALFTIRIRNMSRLPIGIYVKIPSEADAILAASSGEGVFVSGELGNGSAYVKPNSALSGCITGHAG